MRKIFSLILFAVIFSSLVGAVSNPGNIWTVTGSCGDPQDANHYYLGEKVYIMGSGFNPGQYEWFIIGKPGGASCDPNKLVELGIFNVDSTDEFCFEAYTVAMDDCGEYHADFGGKGDNYQVDVSAVVPEFGVLVGTLTILGALGVFFLVRRK